jgi:hypothetical protein
LPDVHKALGSILSTEKQMELEKQATAIKCKDTLTSNLLQSVATETTASCTGKLKAQE